MSGTEAETSHWGYFSRTGEKVGSIIVKLRHRGHFSVGSLVQVF